MKKRLLMLLVILGSAYNSFSQDSMIALEVCSCLYGSPGIDFEAGRNFEKCILRQLELDVNIPNKEAYVIRFLNENVDELICETTNDVDEVSVRDLEPMFKKAIGMGYYGVFKYMDENGRYKNKINLNHVEMVNGEKETVLDYLYNIFENEDLLEEYDADKIASLIFIVRRLGGKRANELK